MVRKSESRTVKPIKIVKKTEIKRLAKLNQAKVRSDALQELSQNVQTFASHVIALAQQYAKNDGRKIVTPDDIYRANMIERGCSVDPEFGMKKSKKKKVI